MEGSDNLRIVLLGKTGAGKSSSANSILGEKLFNTSCSANSDTSTCQAKTKTVNGRIITMIDTPGFDSTDSSGENVKAEVIKCMIECSPGPHAFLIILSVGRHTVQEEKTVNEILKMFGKEALKYAIVLFTHGDQLEAGMTIQQFVDENANLRNLAQKCGGRVHVIDNKYWNHPTDGCDNSKNTIQINMLLNTIRQMVHQNGEYYTNELLKAVANSIEEKMATIKEETKGQSSKTTMREKAKRSIMEKLLKRLVGFTTGALWGTFLGAVGAQKIKKIVCSDYDVASSGNWTTVGAISGAIIGGVVGAAKAEKAETVGEAADLTTNAIKDLTVNAISAIKIIEDATK